MARFLFVARILYCCIEETEKTKKSISGTCPRYGIDYRNRCRIASSVTRADSAPMVRAASFGAALYSRLLAHINNAVMQKNQDV
jgi:hypothetical protein